MADNVIKQSVKAKFTSTGDENEIRLGTETVGDAVYDEPVYGDIYAGGKATDIQDYNDDYPSKDSGGSNTGGGSGSENP